jgi:hypothetical protein
MNKIIYLLWFVPEGDEFEEHAILIGLYENEGSARNAIERLRIKPGFIRYPSGFRIYTRELGHDSWAEGFIVDDKIAGNH